MEQRLTPTEALSGAIEHLGSQAALARLCEVSQPAVWKWVHGEKHLPAEHVLKVEAATGVSRHDLRPDIYPREDGTAHQPPRGASLDDLRAAS